MNRATDESVVHISVSFDIKLSRRPCAHQRSAQVQNRNEHNQCKPLDGGCSTDLTDCAKTICEEHYAEAGSNASRYAVPFPGVG